MTWWGVPVPIESSDVIVVRDLVKRYGRTLALAGVSLDVARGERYAILGPNGAGKTTLIHILCTILMADEGEAIVDGCDVRRQPRRARSRIGVVFQESSLDTRLTARENLEFHGRVFGVPRGLRRRRIDELLELVELTDWQHHLVRSLSKGMQRRLEIARALVHDATLLVLDEPTVGLDAQTRHRMWSHLSELQRQRDLTILVTTHYIDEVDHCDRVCIVDHGEVLTVGTPSELKARHGRSAAHVVARDEATAAALAQGTPGAHRRGLDVTVPLVSEGDAARLLGEHGAGLTAYTLVQPSLETVFLELTGRALRDAPAAARERMLTGPRAGGEPVR